MRRVSIGVVLALLIAAVMLVLWRELHIDVCLDDGGVWDFSTGRCIGSRQP